MTFRLYHLVLLVLLVISSIASHVLGEPVLTWRFGDTVISDNEYFIVKVSSIEMDYTGTGIGEEPHPTMRTEVSLSPDNSLLLLGSDHDQIAVSLAKPPIAAALKDFLGRYESWAEAFSDYAKNEQNRQSWQSSLGSFEVDATRERGLLYGKDGKNHNFICCRINLRSSDGNRRIDIACPGAFLFALNSIPQLVRLHEDALAQRTSNMARQEREKDIERAAKIAAVRSESAQRMREAEAAQRSMIRDAGNADELRQIAEEEVRAKAKLSELVNTEMIRRVAELLATADGTALEERIRSLSLEIRQKQESETRYIKDLEKEHLRLHMIVAPTRAEDLACKAALNAWLNASLTHKDSEDLSKMKTERNGLISHFEGKVGYPFNRAMSEYNSFVKSIGSKDIAVESENIDPPQKVAAAAVEPGTLRGQSNPRPQSSSPSTPTVIPDLPSSSKVAKAVAIPNESAPPTSSINNPDSPFFSLSERAITGAEISGWDAAQLRYAINFLYARQGYVSPTREVQEMFESKPWYKPKNEASLDQIEAAMNATEAANVKVLAEAKARLKSKEK